MNFLERSNLLVSGYLLVFGGLFFILIIFPLIIISDYFLIFYCFLLQVFLFYCLFLRVENILFIISFFSILFLAFYFPVSGIFLQLNFNYKNLLYAVGLRSLTLLAVLFWTFLRIKNKKFLYFLPFFLIAISFLRSSDKFSALIYFVNSFGVLFLCLIFFHYFLKCKSNISYMNDSLRKLFLYCLILVAIISFLYGIFFYKLSSIFRPDLALALKLKGEPWPEGNIFPSWYSVLFDYAIPRFFGTFPDAIKAGWFYSVLLIITFFSNIKPFGFKLFLIFFLFFCLLATLSKGALAFLLMFSFIYFILNFRIIKSFSSLLILVFLLFIIIILLALKFPGSNIVHLMGLYYGFKTILNANFLNFLFGYSLGYGGNLQAIYSKAELWLQTGSESGVGVLLVKMGFLGFLCYLYFFYSICKKAFLKQNYIILSMLIPLFVLSYLQEDLINSSLWSLFLFFFLYFKFKKVTFLYENNNCF